MGFFTNRYPYTDFHELNLDWVIEKIKNHEDRITTIETWKTNTVDPFIASITAWKNNTVDPFIASITAWKGTIDTWKTGIDSWKTTISGTVAGHTSDISALQTGKQDKLIAGSNIQIAADGKTISATDTTYTAGTGISITPENVISASGGTVADAFVVTFTESGGVITADKTFAEISTAIASNKTVYGIESGVSANGYYMLSSASTSAIVFTNTINDGDDITNINLTLANDESVTTSSATIRDFDRTTLSVTLNTWESTGNAYQSGVTMNYPEGFSQSNVVLLDLQWSVNDGLLWNTFPINASVNVLGSLVLKQSVSVGFGETQIAVVAIDSVNTETVKVKMILGHTWYVRGDNMADKIEDSKSPIEIIKELLA